MGWRILQLLVAQKLITRQRKCKVCKNWYMPQNSLEPCCNQFSCRLAYATAYTRKRAHNAIQEVRRASAVERAQRRADKERVKATSELHRGAQRAFNAFIVYRDRHLPCICCGATEAAQWAAGHYRTVAAAGHLRYNEDNVHKQRNRPCNADQGGNLVGYRAGLVARIGEERVLALENDNRVHKYTRDELREIAKIYRKKLRELHDPDDAGA